MLEKLTREQLIQEIKFRDMEMAGLKKKFIRGQLLSEISSLVDEVEEFEAAGQDEMLRNAQILLNVMNPDTSGEKELNFLKEVLESELREQRVFNAGYNKALSDNPFKRLFERKRK